MEIVYRKLLVSEAQDFWNMMNQLDYETKFMLYEPGEREQKAYNIPALEGMIESASQDENFLLAAEADGKIVGFLMAIRGDVSRTQHTAYIVVGIRKAYQGIGIGTEFFRRLDVWAGEKQVTRLELTVVCRNAAALHLYQKSGFEIEGTKKNSLLVDGAYMDEYYMAKIR